MSLLMSREEREALEAHERRLLETPGKLLEDPAKKHRGPERKRHDDELKSIIASAWRKDSSLSYRKVAISTGLTISQLIRLGAQVRRELGLPTRLPNGRRGA